MLMIEYHQYNANTPLQWGVSMVSENAMLSDIYALCRTFRSLFESKSETPVQWVSKHKYAKPRKVVAVCNSWPWIDMQSLSLSLCVCLFVFVFVCLFV